MNCYGDLFVEGLSNIFKPLGLSVCSLTVPKNNHRSEEFVFPSFDIKINTRVYSKIPKTIRRLLTALFKAKKVKSDYSEATEYSFRNQI
jgi:hypothetical protein